MLKNDTKKLAAPAAILLAGAVVGSQPAQGTVCSFYTQSFFCADNGTGGCTQVPSQFTPGMIPYSFARCV